MNLPELDAEECAADALYKAINKISLFREGKAKLTTWVFQIAQNCAIDLQRQRQIDSVSLEAAGEISIPLETTVFAGLNAPLLNELRRNLEALPQEERCLLLWRANSCSYAEIAGWLGIKESTARVRHLRAMKKLKVTLGQPEEAEIATEREVSEDE